MRAVAPGAFRLSFCALLLMFLPVPAQAQDYCSLVVKVVSPDGRRPEVSVTVVEKGRRTEERGPTSANVEFCDLGGLPVTVKVGDDDTCNQVIVHEVPVAWLEPYVLVVTYDPTRCDLDLPRSPVPVCRIVFRVEEAGGWAQGVHLRVSQPVPADLQTDRFGRASIVAKVGDEVKGFATLGDRAANFSFTCNRDEPVHEEWIALGSRP